MENEKKRWEYDVNAHILYKHKLADRFLELNKDLSRFDRKLVLYISTEKLIEIGKALHQVYLLIEEYKAKHPTFVESLNKQIFSVEEYKTGKKRRM